MSAHLMSAFSETFFYIYIVYVYQSVFQGYVRFRDILLCLLIILFYSTEGAILLGRSLKEVPYRRKIRWLK